MGFECVGIGKFLERRVSALDAGEQPPIPDRSPHGELPWSAFPGGDVIEPWLLDFAAVHHELLGLGAFSSSRSREWYLVHEER